MSDWKQYYKNLEGRSVRPFFLEALNTIDIKEGQVRAAIDLGCGDGTESLYLLQQGWLVAAIDQAAAAIQLLFKQCNAPLRKNLSVQVSSFEKAKLPSVDFVYAGLSLPYCSPNVFEQAWQHIVESMKADCVFAGHFYGENDDWVEDPNMTFLAKEKVQALFEGFDIILLRDLEEDATTALGNEKHWHYFEIVAKKQ